MAGEQEYFEALADDALRVLLNAGYTPKLEIISGNPRLILPPATLEWGTNMIFVGAISTADYSLGSVAWAIANRASCTVELIR